MALVVEYIAFGLAFMSISVAKAMAIPVVIFFSCREANSTAEDAAMQRSLFFTLSFLILAYVLFSCGRALVQTAFTDGSSAETVRASMGVAQERAAPFVAKFVIPAAIVLGALSSVFLFLRRSWLQWCVAVLVYLLVSVYVGYLDRLLLILCR